MDFFRGRTYSLRHAVLASAGRASICNNIRGWSDTLCQLYAWEYQLDVGGAERATCGRKTLQRQKACLLKNKSSTLLSVVFVVASMPRWLSEEDDGEYVLGSGCSGMQEPPATPVARDELALRRHRFFSDLLQAAQNSTEHRVRFDPLGPMVHTG